MNFPKMEDGSMDETFARFNVLSLEDSIADFEIISDQLVKAGYNLNISRIEKESEFSWLIRNNTYDIILADFNLPQFDAFGALKLCSEYCPDVPFICVSGSIGEITAIELLKMGAVDYVLKDRLERLPFAVKRALDEAKEKTKRKDAEEALRKSEERLRDIIFSTADWVWEVDENGRFTYSSQRDIDLFGVAPDEIIGKTPFNLMPDDEAKRVSEIFLEIVSKREPIKDLENWNIGKDGKLICLLTNGLPIFDDKGKLTGYRGIDKNITDRKQSEEIIKQSEANLNYAQELAKMGNWDFDVIANKYKWSRNMYQMLGLTPFEFEPTFEDFFNRVHPDDRFYVDIFLRKILDEKKPVNYNFRFVLPDEKIIWVENKITPVFKDDVLIEIHGVNIDITEKKQSEDELIKAKERAEASDRLKTAFMNNISHEIRTPLNGILGFGQIITDPDFEDDEKGEYYRMLNESSDRLLNTITNIMDISILTSGNMQTVKTEVLLKDLIYKVIEKYRASCSQKQILLSLKMPPDRIDYKVITDADIVGKILHQLIDNAVKFTTQGTIDVSLEAKDNEIQFSVCDTGIGVSEENKKHIFKNFMQGDFDNTRRYEGTGIGLSIAKALVELLGGKIWLESEKGKGSTFYFSLPA